MSRIHSPEQFRLLAVGAAAFELNCARSLANVLPMTADFDAHADTALAIGACGRRMELLLGVYPLHGHNPVEAGFPVWPPCSEIESCSSTTVYRLLLAISEPFKLAAYDLRQVLQLCLALSADSKNISETIDTETLIRGLENAARASISICPSSAKRVRRGSVMKRHDPRWRLASPKDPLFRMRRVEEVSGLLQKLHHTAFRETVASEIVGLNLLEYEGMPWAFYIDMTRQCEDEARHSLQAARLLYDRGSNFEAYPLPYLGNYYEMFWDMGLTERLIALNLDIEAVGNPHLGDVAGRLAVIGDDAAAFTFSAIQHDERRHARIGTVWLRYLYPNSDDRRSAIEACRVFLGINLASASSRLIGGDLIGTIERWAAGDPIFVFNEPMGAMHEQEVTPLLARSSTYRATE